MSREAFASTSSKPKIKCPICEGACFVNLHGIREQECFECGGDGWIFAQPTPTRLPAERSYDDGEGR